ncbi:Cerato-platanin [Gaertneriomyces semiglobifer]|nr:Cerato-platanin [Gaertneriomyces semiglobifer]
MYEASTPTSSIACSDGPNGLLTTHSYKNLAPLFPYVSAASFAGHSSPQCGTCWRLVGPKGSITVSVIDQCGEQSGYDAHFDIAPEAFNKLSDQGHQDGHVEVGYMQVPKDYCLGLFGY